MELAKGFTELDYKVLTLLSRIAVAGKIAKARFVALEISRVNNPKVAVKSVTGSLRKLENKKYAQSFFMHEWFQDEPKQWGITSHGCKFMIEHNIDPSALTALNIVTQDENNTEVVEWDSSTGSYVKKDT